MATPVLWKGVAVSMESVKGAAVTITAISKASPGVVLTATPPTAGAVVLLTVQGMSQLEGRAVRVGTVVASTSFELEGLDTTLFSTFTSGSFQLITLGTSITSATTVSVGGGDPNSVDTTTIHADIATSIPGLPSPSTFAMDHIWDPTDAGQAAMRAAFIAQGTRVFKFTFGSGGRIMLFNGYVAATGIPAGTAQGLVTTPTSITLTAVPSYYTA